MKTNEQNTMKFGSNKKEVMELDIYFFILKKSPCAVYNTVKRNKGKKPNMAYVTSSL